MSRLTRRKKHVLTGAQINELIVHNVDQGFQEGKAVAIAKATEMYSVVMAYALLKADPANKELVNAVLNTFTSFQNNEIDYNEAIQFVTDNGIVFKFMPDDVKEAAESAQP